MVSRLLFSTGRSNFCDVEIFIFFNKLKITDLSFFYVEIFFPKNGIETVDALCFQVYNPDQGVRGELRHGQIERHLTLRSGLAGVY